jgi:hypothetical protein
LCNKYETLIRSGYHRIAQPSHFYDWTYYEYDDEWNDIENQSNV